MPNLRWMPTTSPNPESSHREFWTKKLTLPIDDPFWLEHHPGDRWNCKCSLEQTDEPATPELKPLLDGQKPQAGLENNPGGDGRIFSDRHPYFPKSCARCAFYKPSLKARLASLFHDRKKECYNCPYIDACIDKTKEREATCRAMRDKRKRMMDEMPTFREHETASNLNTGEILRSRKALKRLLNHCVSHDELDAAEFLWNNVGFLDFVRHSPMGEGKDLNDERTRKNIRKKRERGIVSYNLYHLIYNEKIWNVKLEVHKDGFEMPYFIRKVK